MLSNTTGHNRSVCPNCKATFIKKKTCIVLTTSLAQTWVLYVVACSFIIEKVPKAQLIPDVWPIDDTWSIPLCNLRNKLQVSDCENSNQVVCFRLLSSNSKEPKEKSCCWPVCYLTENRHISCLSLCLYLNNACFLVRSLIREVGCLLFPYKWFLGQTKATFIVLFSI